MQVADGQGLSWTIFLPSSYQILTKFLLKFIAVEDGEKLDGIWLGDYGWAMGCRRLACDFFKQELSGIGQELTEIFF